MYTPPSDVKIPRLTVAYVAVELERAVLGQYADSVNTGVGAVGERKVDNPVLSAKGNAGFCHVLGQRVESRTCPPASSIAIQFFFMAASFELTAG